MFIKTVSTTSGINRIKWDETGGVFYWILKTGLSTVYAATKSTFTAGDDGVVSLGPKESRRLETNNDTIYILGAGQVEIHNQRDGICSFKQAPTSSGSGGGGTIDAYSKTESDAKYAQKTDIPTTLPANGGNADTVDGLHADDFVNANDRDQIQIPSNVDVPMWIHANGKRFQRYMTNGGNIGLANVPDNSTDYVWYWYDGLNILARDYSSGKYYICDVINGVFSGWKDVYTSRHKPYVTGAVTITDTKTTITTNHGFIPSAVFWWKNSGHSDLIRDYALNSAIEFTDSTITIDYRETSPSSGTNWTLYYIIFK